MTCNFSNQNKIKNPIHLEKLSKFMSKMHDLQFLNLNNWRSNLWNAKLIWNWISQKIKCFLKLFWNNISLKKSSNSSQNKEFAEVFRELFLHIHDAVKTPHFSVSNWLIFISSWKPFCCCRSENWKVKSSRVTIRVKSFSW